MDLTLDGPIALLPRLRIEAAFQPGGDFGPWPLMFFQADGVTPIDLAAIVAGAAAATPPVAAFTLQIGALATLTSAEGGGVEVSGNALFFYCPRPAWSGRAFALTLTVSDGVFTRQLLAASWLRIGPPAQFEVRTLERGAMALSTISAAAGLALIATMAPGQRQLLTALLADFAAAYVPDLDFSHVANSQYIGSTPFLFTFG